MVILAFFALAAPRSVAQGGRPQLKRPEDMPREKPPEEKKKKIKGPRAIGVLQLNGGKGTLVPIAILIDGRFYDASAYKADPVPMALESGTVYEAEQAGDSQGLFTIGGALHSKSAGILGPWLGTGSYLPNGTEAPKSTRKAEDVPVGLDNNSDSDAPPRLTRREAAKPAASNPSSASGPAAAEKPGGTAPSGPVSSQPASGSSSGTTSGQDSQKPPGATASEPAAQGGKGQATATGPVAAAQTSAGEAATSRTPPSEASENYYRPTLRRGKPTQAAPQEDETATKAGTGKPEATIANTAGAPVQIVAAISDAGGPGPQSYKFFWKPGEEEERRNQMLALAGDEVRAYAAALVKNHIPANPPARPPAKGQKTPVKPAQPVFEDIQFRGFDVWLNSQVVMIFSAEAHFPSAPGATVTPESYSIALVARTDIYGDLRKLYSGVTDKFHLDVTPRLELIDVVDADGDGRGELLFRETADTGSGYVIYRATADKLWKMFDSLNAE